MKSSLCFSQLSPTVVLRFDLIPKSSVAASKPPFHFDSSHLEHFLIQIAALVKNKGALISKGWVSSASLRKQLAANYGEYVYKSFSSCTRRAVLFRALAGNMVNNKVLR